uniref:Sorting nexin-32 n=1 Tax=Lepeophtheirus salmonis TaxID=72036 RepID=D3PGN5_LEPSM|nr:Sorting nexin-32 [Lepeophtheirus salmonis]
MMKFLLSIIVGCLTKEEFDKMKQELEAEYLACFKKTVAMHEAFLCRLTIHNVFRYDRNLHIFLEYGKDLNVRGKNKKEVMLQFFNSVQKSGDELLLSSTIKDIDDFFNKEKSFLLDYHVALRDSTSKSDKMCSSHRTLAYNFNKLSDGVKLIGSSESDGLSSFLMKLSDTLEKMYRVEARVASDEDLKLSDTLRYHMRDTTAAKDLLFRRLRCLSNYETANKNLDKARARNKDLEQVENEQQECFDTFNNISAKAKEELGILKTRRISSFQKSLVELAELELKHAKSHAQMLKSTITTLRADL